MEYLSQKKGFLGYEANQNIKTKVIIVPFGLEKTVSYGSGTKNGPKEIIKASHQVELFDEELNKEPYKEIGIKTVKPFTIKKKIEDALNQLSTINQSNIADQSQKLQSIESSNKSLLELRKDIKSLNTDILLMEESLQALNNYRKQNNAVIVQLQNEIRLLNSSILNLEKSSPAKGDNFLSDESISE